MSFWSDKSVLVTGGHGFVGSSVLKLLETRPCEEVHAPTSSDFDLRNEAEVDELYSDSDPDIVIHLAGRVGGIEANKTYPGVFFYDNITMGTFVTEMSREYGVEKLVSLAAGCGYPAGIETPYSEDEFWDGLPDENSLPYAMAKKMLIVQSWAYRKQYDFDSSVLLPANLYGPRDNFDLETSHVVPALVRKFVEAEINDEDTVTVWGTGEPTREFLYVEDTAEALLRVAEDYDETGPLNLGTGVETSIRELAEQIKDLSGFDGELVWDTSKPDGQKRRKFDMSKFRDNLDYVPDTSLREGLRKTISWYRKNRKRILANPKDTGFRGSRSK